MIIYLTVCINNKCIPVLWVGIHLLLTVCNEMINEECLSKQERIMDEDV